MGNKNVDFLVYLSLEVKVAYALSFRRKCACRIFFQSNLYLYSQSNFCKIVDQGILLSKNITFEYITEYYKQYAFCT